MLSGPWSEVIATRIDIDLTDKELLNILQSSFPVAAEPYGVIAEQLDMSEEDVLQRVYALKKRNVVRQISAIFDTRKLGYKTTLVAFRYPPGALDKAARVINRHPGVSHNYARNGHFNLWFTLAVPPHHDLGETIDHMAKATGAEAARVMPTLRFFKIGVNFDMVKEKGAAYDYYSPDGFGGGASTGGIVGDDWNRAQDVTPFEVEVIRELQEDLPLEFHPFEGIATRLGVSVPELFAVMTGLQERGLMRRYSAVLYHRRAGFRSNAMAVWAVPEDRAVEVGMAMAQSPWVTHCYQRPTFPDWRFTHFTMIHATTQDQCEDVAREISEATGITDFQLLYSTREYKKTRVRYFVEHEYDAALQEVSS
jgi:DNA-binding Lrp family transcriptional regulator